MAVTAQAAGLGRGATAIRHIQYRRSTILGISATPALVEKESYRAAATVSTSRFSVKARVWGATISGLPNFVPKLFPTPPNSAKLETAQTGLALMGQILAS